MSINNFNHLEKYKSAEGNYCITYNILYILDTQNSGITRDVCITWKILVKVLLLTSNQFVSERLGLRDGAQTTGGDLLSVQLYRLLGNVKPLLDDRRQLTDPASFLAEHALCPRRHNDDLRAGRSDAHLHTGVAILSQLPGQELIEFRLENSVPDELQIHGEVMF